MTAAGRVRRAHRMPFGAAVERGGVRFRLWAPAEARVDLVLEPSGDRLSMDGVGAP